MYDVKRRTLERGENLRLLDQARLAFEATRDIRVERQKNFKYYTGDQWSELMEDPDTGKMITEEQFIRKQGRIPAKQNLIGKTIRNLAGQFRSNYPDPVAFARTREDQGAGETMTTALQYALDINEVNELDAQNLKEFTIGGVVGWKIGYKWWSEFNREDVYISNIDPTRFFYNVDSTDIRGHDIRMCGELHDMTINQVISRFGYTFDDKSKVQAMFNEGSEDWEIQNIPQYKKKYRDFYLPDNPDKVRVIELWKEIEKQVDFLIDRNDGSWTRFSKSMFWEDLGYPREFIEQFSKQELVDKLNEARLIEATNNGVDPNIVKPFELDSRMEDVSHYFFLTPNGHVLRQGETPYRHEGNPYVFGRYQIDGKVVSLAGSIRDQQRHVNRLISMMDASLGRSLKKVMMIDTDSLPEKYKGDYQAYADEMVKMNNMVFYTSNDGRANMPKEISSSSMPADAMNLLNLQAELLKDISAVTDAVQGKEPRSGTPASLYAQQTLNASLTNKDIFDFYFSLIRKRNRKVIQVIQQFYDTPRHIKISGTGFSGSSSTIFEPEAVQDVDFDVVIGESQNTLAYRQTVDEQLKEFLGAQLITFEEYLESTSMPYADKLLQMIRNRDNQGAQGGLPSGVTPEMAQQYMDQQQGQQQITG